MGWDDISLQMESESNDSSQNFLDEDETENPPKKARDPNTDDLVSKYLMEGHVLVPSTCPDCASPLIKSMKRTPDEYEEYYEAGGFLNLEILTVRRLKPFKRGDIIGCVPYCVSCKCVVVTSHEELTIMWEEKHKHLMAEKGAVLLAMNQTDEYDRPTSSVHKARPTSAEKAPMSVNTKPARRPSVTKQIRNGIVLLSRTEDDSDDEIEKEVTSRKTTHEEEKIVNSIQHEDKDKHARSTTNPDKQESSSSQDAPMLLNSDSEEENDIDVTTVPYEKR